LPSDLKRPKTAARILAEICLKVSQEECGRYLLSGNRTGLGHILKMVLFATSAIFFFSSCLAEEPSILSNSKVESELPRYSTIPQCQNGTGAGLVKRDVFDGKLSLVDGSCLSISHLKFLGETAAVFKIVNNGNISICQEVLDFTSIPLNDEGVGLNKGGQFPTELPENDTASYLVGLRSDVDLTLPPYTLSPIRNDLVTSAYSYNVNAHALQVLLVERSVFDGGELPVGFSRMFNTDKVKANIAEGRILPRTVPGQPIDDSLQHYYFRSKGRSYGVEDRDHSSGLAYDLENFRFVRMFGAPELASPFSLVGVQRRSWQLKHDFYVKAKQVIPDGKVLVEHGVARDQLFRMTEIFDVTDRVLMDAKDNCHAGPK